MKKFLILFFILLSPNLFAGALKDTEEFVKAVKKTNMSKGAAWLEQQSNWSPSEWDKVILIFGYFDDNFHCEDIIIEAYKKRFPTERFRCNPVD